MAAQEGLVPSLLTLADSVGTAENACVDVLQVYRHLEGAITRRTVSQIATLELRIYIPLDLPWTSVIQL